MGNGITRAFNWMGVTFAEQGVAAFVSARRHNLLLYTCIMLHWVGRGSFLLQTWKLTVTLRGVFAHFSVNGRLVETWRSGSGKKINTCDQSTYMCSTASFWRHSWLSTTHKCQQNHESISMDISAPDWSAFCTCIRAPSAQARALRRGFAPLFNGQRPSL